MRQTINNIYYKHKETITNFIWRGAQIAGKQGILLLITFFAARVLSIYDFGNFSYYFAIIMLFSMVSDFGISTAISKFYAEYNYKDKTGLNSVFLSSLLILSIFCLIVFIIFIPVNSIFLKSDILFLLSPLVFLIPFSSLFDGAFRGLEKFKDLSAIAISSSFLSFIIAIYLINNYNLLGLIFSYLIFYLILSLFSFVYYLFISKAYGNFSINITILKKIIKYSLYLGLASVSYFLFSRFSIVYLGYLNEIKLVALLELIWRIEAIFLLPFFIFGHTLAPKITHLHESGQFVELFSKFKRLWKFSIIFSAISTLAFFAFIYSLFNFFFREYMIYNFDIIIITTSILFLIKSYAVLIDFSFIISTGKGSLMGKIYLFISILNFPLMIIFNKFIGNFGVLLAILLSHLIMVILLHRSYFQAIRR